jgi:hypothetical protein
MNSSEKKKKKDIELCCGRNRKRSRKNERMAKLNTSSPRLYFLERNKTPVVAGRFSFYLFGVDQQIEKLDSIRRGWVFHF